MEEVLQDVFLPNWRELPRQGDISCGLPIVAVHVGRHGWIHALRNKLPAKDKENRSTRGAVFLASQAIPLFPCFSVHGKLRTTGFLRLDRDDWFAWPIWSEPISLNMLRSLLAQPLDHNLKRRGVDAAYRCLIAHTGGAKSNYRVFGNAVEHSLESHQ
jgi:hypothetical protein